MGALKITRPETTVDLCLDAALQAEWETAQAALVEAGRGVQDDRLASTSAKTVAAERVQEIEQRMRASVATFRLRAMRRSEWAERAAAHPPREGDQDDKMRGINRETFFDDVIARSIVEVTQGGEPVDFDPKADWTPLADEMTDQQYTDFAQAVQNLNRGEVGVPFSRSASLILRRSSENSASPAS